MVFSTGSSRSLQTLNSFFKTQPAYAKYGNGKYQRARNVVSLLTNAVRVELRDILHILKTIANRPHLLTRDLVGAVYLWMEGSVHYMNVSLDVLLHEVMGNTAEKVEDMGALKASKRVLAVGRVQRSLMKLLETETSFSYSLPPGERFENLCNAASELRECLRLLSVTDETLPGLMKEGFSSSDLKRFERRVFSFLAEKSGGLEVVDGIMTRWMTKRQTEYMKNRRGMIFSRTRVERARVRNGAEHGKLPKEIKKILDKEEEAQKDMMQDVMDPDVQRRLNSAAQKRLAKRFSGFVAAEDCSDEDNISCSSDDEF